MFNVLYCINVSICKNTRAGWHAELEFRILNYKKQKVDSGID